MNRRNIIKQGTLASAAVILPAAASSAAQSQQAVLKGLSAYSGSVLPVAKDNEVHVLASIDNMEAFVDAEVRRQALPFDDIKAEGNVLSFTHGGKAYKVENVLPQHFNSRAKALS